MVLPPKGFLLASAALGVDPSPLKNPPPPPPDWSSSCPATQIFIGAFLKKNFRPRHSRGPQRIIIVYNVPKLRGDNISDFDIFVQ